MAESAQTEAADEEAAILLVRSDAATCDNLRIPRSAYAELAP
ncbi:predicted protein [Chaetomium globosum CBS 148.51]|uniref:Uncharacterized protein n=1 Tax=Chaetomium globosum (strain ATCC 6205 / CBS 148.51 / DSM 1962 / NBRC 6347 / NRRL 1970) TaxID=306901 RepID=Q2HHH7_CHAGB|nr:uncharacterized protein CHGG_00327 [Chaetomium globosum CBS 148.51]EAQ92092.1 predicted protein [Chaetomium globosum CBS 148.51]